MKKVITLIGIAALFSFAVNAQSNPASLTAQPASTTTQAASNPNAPEITFEEEVYNFGTIKQGEVATYEFVFTNTGKEPLIISNAQASCGCTVPNWPKEPIKKGEKGRIKASFNSAGKTGLQDKTITITSNAKNGTKVLHMKGNIDKPAEQSAPAGTPNK